MGEKLSEGASKGKACSLPIPGRRQWHPTPVVLPGESHGRRSLVGYSPWGCWVRHDWATSLSLFTFMHWRRKWRPTPVFLPGESQGQGSLVGCRLWGRTESGTTEATQQQQQQQQKGSQGKPEFQGYTQAAARRKSKWCPALSSRDGRSGIAVFLKVAVKVLSRWKRPRCDYIPKRLYVWETVSK